MTVMDLPIPKCTMGDGFGRLDDALIDLDSARFALAFLMETACPEDHSADTIQCIMNTLAEARAKLKGSFYRFLDIQWVKPELAVEQAREQNRPILAIVMWGDLDDQSC